MACCNLLRENSAVYATRAIDNGWHNCNYVVSAVRLARILGRNPPIPKA